MQQSVRRPVVRHEDVRPAVIVEIAGDDPQTGSRRVIRAQRHGLLCEVAVMVDVELIPLGAVAVRRAAAHHLARLAEGHGRVVVHIVSHVQVEPAVTIYVNKGAPGAPRPGAAQDARLLGDLVEGAVSAVAKQKVSSEPGDEQVIRAVIIEVSHAAAHRVAVDRDASTSGDVGEAAIPEISVQPAPRPLSGLGEVVPGADQEEILPAVAIVIEEAAATTHRLHDRQWDTMAVGVAEVDPALGCYVHEAEWRRSRRRSRRSGWHSRRSANGRLSRAPGQGELYEKRQRQDAER